MASSISSSYRPETAHCEGSSITNISQSIPTPSLLLSAQLHLHLLGQGARQALRLS